MSAKKATSLPETKSIDLNETSERDIYQSSYMDYYSLDSMYNTYITSAGSSTASITGTGYGGGGGTYSVNLTGAGSMSSVYSISGGAGWASNNYVNNTITANADITISRKGKEINVAETLELIVEHLNLIIPDKKLLNDNPSLKLAYDNYLEVLSKISNPELKSAVESYKVLEQLVKDEA